MQERDLIKFDERGTSGGRPVEKERMGIGWKDAVKFEFAKGSDGGDSLRNSRRGKGMTFCQRRDGTRRAGDEADLEILGLTG